MKNTNSESTSKADHNEGKFGNFWSCRCWDNRQTKFRILLHTKYLNQSNQTFSMFVNLLKMIEFDLDDLYMRFEVWFVMKYRYVPLLWCESSTLRQCFMCWHVIDCSHLVKCSLFVALKSNVKVVTESIRKGMWKCGTLSEKLKYVAWVKIQLRVSPESVPLIVCL